MMQYKQCHFRKYRDKTKAKNDALTDHLIQAFSVHICIENVNNL